MVFYKPVFFWNCDLFYPLKFDFKVLKQENKISFDLLERVFDWDFMEAYVENTNNTPVDLENNE